MKARETMVSVTMGESSLWGPLSPLSFLRYDLGRGGGRLGEGGLLTGRNSCAPGNAEGGPGPAQGLSTSALYLGLLTTYFGHKELQAIKS